MGSGDGCSSSGGDILARNIVLGNKGGVTIKSLLMTILLFSIVLYAFIGAFGSLSANYPDAGVGGTQLIGEENISGLADSLQSNATSISSDMSAAFEENPFSTIPLVGGIASVISGSWAAISNIWGISSVVEGAIALISTQLGLDPNWIMAIASAIITITLIGLILKLLFGGDRVR